MDQTVLCDIGKHLQMLHSDIGPRRVSNDVSNLNIRCDIWLSLVTVVRALFVRIRKRYECRLRPQATQE